MSLGVLRTHETLDRPVFSFDVETDGLWGNSFAIGALVYSQNGEEIDRFTGRIPDDFVTNDWVIKNVLPELEGMPPTHEEYTSLLADFAVFYLKHKEGKDIIVHMGYPVETKVLSDMHTCGLIGDFDGPFPLLDISGHLQQVGEDPTSVDSYVKKHDLRVRDFGGGIHNPLYDSEATFVTYCHLRQLGHKVVDS